MLGDAKTGTKTRPPKTMAVLGGMEARAGKLGALDAAAKVRGERGQAMTCKKLIGAMTAQGYWTSPGGQTPHATLYAAILREVVVTGTNARFKKTERAKPTLKGAT
jgi:hypothetical protein